MLRGEDTKRNLKHVKEISGYVGPAKTTIFRRFCGPNRIVRMFGDPYWLDSRCSPRHGSWFLMAQVCSGSRPAIGCRLTVPIEPQRTFRTKKPDKMGSSGKWGGGTWFGGFRIPNLVPRSLVNIVGCSSRGRGNCGKLRATSNWASKPVIRSFPSAVRTVEKQLRALASSPPELLVFPRFA